MSTGVKISDRTIIDFATSQGCTDVVVTRGHPITGKSKNIYVSYTCSCDRPGLTMWKTFKEQPLCTICLYDERPRTLDADIRIYVEENGCEYIDTRRVPGKHPKIYVSFICKCDNGTRTVHECRWDQLKINMQCHVCGNNDRIEAVRKAHRERGEEIKEQTKRTCMEKYGVEFVTQTQEHKESVSATVIENSPVTDNIIRTRLKELDMEFIKSERKMNELLKIHYICKCDIDTTRIIEIKPWVKFNVTTHSTYGCNKCKDKRMANTCIERYGYAYPHQNAEIHQKAKDTMIERYGVEHSMQNAEIKARQNKSAFINKTIVGPLGKVFTCQGWEPFALEILLKKYHENDILDDDTIATSIFLPQFWYEYEGNQHRYYPDLYIMSERKFIEVKSDWTITLDPAKILAKQECVFKAGYDIEIWTFNSKKELTIN